MKQKVDLIIHNTLIYKVDDAFSTAHAAAINNHRFVKVASNREIFTAYTSDNIIDLHGKFVYPGFFDSHCHYYYYAMELTEIELSGTNSIEDMMERIKVYAENSTDGWLIGHGWNENDWHNKKMPNKQLLDNMFPNRPLLLERYDKHTVLVNSKALNKIAFDYKKNMNGGKIVMENSKPTGILIDKAALIAKSHLPQPTVEKKYKALLQAQKNCLSVGLTTVADAGLNVDEVELINKLVDAKLLNMNLFIMLNPNDDNREQFIEKGIYRKNGLKIGGIKLFADGALGPRSALMLEPYSDAPSQTGLLTTPVETLKKYCKLAYKHGYQSCTHAIGDAANRLVLQLYGGILKEKNDLRWRIEHAQVVDDQDFKLFSDFSVIPSVQTSHAIADMIWAAKRLGTRRIKNAYAFKRLLQTNGWLPNGSDFTVVSINPLIGFYAAVSRRDLNGYPKQGFHVEEALTREETLRSMTIWAAKGIFEEKEKGSIEPGKQADFVVTNQDIMKVDVNRIPETKVVATFIKGRKLFSI